MIIPLALVAGFTGGLITCYVSQYRTPCGNNAVGHKLAHITGVHSQSVCGIAFGKYIADGLAEGLRKGMVNMTISKLKKGDFVRYLGGDTHYDDNLTVGKVYEIALVYRSGEVSIYDDAGNLWNIHELNEDCFVKVYDELMVEPVVSDYEKKTHTFEEKPNEGEVTDAVNSPLHYKRGKFETIEIIEHMTQGYSDPFVSYCVGNTVKYVDRAPYKHATPVEDLRKAAWYLTRAADYIEGKSGAKDE